MEPFSASFGSSFGGSTGAGCAALERTRGILIVTEVVSSSMFMRSGVLVHDAAALLQRESKIN